MRCRAVNQSRVLTHQFHPADFVRTELWIKQHLRNGEQLPQETCCKQVWQIAQCGIVFLETMLNSTSTPIIFTAVESKNNPKNFRRFKDYSINNVNKITCHYFLLLYRYENLGMSNKWNKTIWRTPYCLISMQHFSILSGSFVGVWAHLYTLVSGFVSVFFDLTEIP